MHEIDLNDPIIKSELGFHEVLAMLRGVVML
jgi:hypothetical protein